MKNLALSDLNNCVVNYYFAEIIENSDEEVKEYGIEKFEKVYCGYGGVVKDNIYYDITDDSDWGKAESFGSVSEYLENDYSEDDDERWCFNIEESCADVDEFAKNIADSFREYLCDEECESRILDDIIYVDIWKDGEKIYSKEIC